MPVSRSRSSKSVRSRTNLILGDEEENVNKYIDTMQKMYAAARKMKQNGRIADHARED